MEAKPRPLLGAFLGFLLGIVAVALLWQLGVTPPDRLAVFGVVSLMMFVVVLMTTQAIAIVKARFVVAMVIASLLGAVALTGIPAAFGSGSLTEGCYVEGTSSLDTKTPDATKASDPFDVTRDDTVVWTASTDNVLKNWTSALGVQVGGFNIPIWTGESENADEDTMWNGEDDVAGFLEDIAGATGVEVSGTFIVFGYINAAEGGRCDMTGYVRVESPGAFSGALMIALWVTLVVLIVVIVAVTVAVKRSIAAAAAAATAGAAGDGLGTRGDGNRGDFQQTLREWNQQDKEEARDKGARNDALYEQLADVPAAEPDPNEPKP